MSASLQGETTELLQQLIRNGCVNDGTPDSGNERRNADTLADLLTGAGLEVQRFTPQGERTSIVARIEGWDPTAPKVCLMGHTDVVPFNASGWREDPLGGELIDGEVWGRGAIDMLNLTASMAVAVRHLARSGFRPRGDLIYFGVADEEAMGTWGAKWMCEHHWDAIACDYVLTELGGWSVQGPAGHKVGISVGEKGLAWRKLRIKGTPGHGSMPLGADNALIKAAEVIRRIAAYRPRARIDSVWRAQVEAARLPDDLKAALLDPERIFAALEQLPPAAAKHLHACCHTTFSPNVAHGGVKANVIPDLVEVDVDIRTVPGTTAEDVDNHLREALGDALFAEVEVISMVDHEATLSPLDTPMWDALSRQLKVAYPAAEFLPQLLVGGTDARFFRDRGVVGYGTGLFVPNVTMEEFGSRFHGHNERIDVTSLGLCANLWTGVVKDLLG
ncbi:MAG: M20/M25/M40 family metallo-hydrolase [Gammaproteobacteria bacterium]|nr:M20/M25/M40 family metallo-hydrolase [Gammaproteobacteria bacterium]